MKKSLVKKIGWANQKKHADLAEAIFVLSQKALHTRFLELMTLQQINSGEINGDAAIKAKQAVDRKHRHWQFFQSKRMTVLRDLIANQHAKLLNYVEVEGVPYGQVSYGSHKFFVIINKRIVAYYKLEKTGNSLPDLPLFELDDLKNKYMSKSKAEKIFLKYFHMAQKKKAKKL